MESTGVYWKPVFNILESGCQLIVVNARHIKQVPGRKTDKADCAWIASLLRHGLLEASFVPELEVRQLRDLCRMRTTLVRECVQVGNRLRRCSKTPTSNWTAWPAMHWGSRAGT